LKQLINYISAGNVFSQILSKTF